MNAYVAIKFIQTSLMKNLKSNLRTYLTFSDNDINKFILLLKKGAYPSEYMDDWEEFNETTLPEKEEFYCNLNMEVLQMQITYIEKEFVKTLK